MAEETIRSNGPVGLWFGLVGKEKGIVRECGQDGGV